MPPSFSLGSSSGSGFSFSFWLLGISMYSFHFHLMLHLIQSAFAFIAGKATQSAKFLETSISDYDRIWDRQWVTEGEKCSATENLATAPPLSQDHIAFAWWCSFYKAVVITTTNEKSAVTRECRSRFRV